MARTTTGEGIAPATDKNAPVRYYASKCGPNFACGANNKLPCAWGAVKVMLAFGKLTQEKKDFRSCKGRFRSEWIFCSAPTRPEQTILCGHGDKPSGNWWKFGFPVFYVTDILQIAEALAGLGYARDPRLANTLKLIKGKQDEQGRWPLEYDYNGKTWVDFGAKKQPNKW